MMLITQIMQENLTNKETIGNLGKFVYWGWVLENLN